MTTPFSWLDAATLQQVFKAAIQVGLSRSALLSGLPRTLSAKLPRAETPADQLLEDLRYFDGLESIEDGSVPLRSWLDTAVLLTEPRREAVVFRRAIEKMDQRAPTQQEQAPGPRPAGLPGSQPPGSTPIWTAPDLGALWQHRHFQPLVSVMKNVTPAELRDMAGLSGVDTAQVHWGQAGDPAAKELIEKSWKAMCLDALIRTMAADGRLGRWRATLEEISRG